MGLNPGGGLQKTTSTLLIFLHRNQERFQYPQTPGKMQIGGGEGKGLVRVVGRREVQNVYILW